MLSFEWDALRVGDRVLVHPDELGAPLQRGEVVTVDMRRSRGANDVGVRIANDEGATIVRRPRRLSTHLDPMVADSACLRCSQASHR